MPHGGGAFPPWSSASAGPLPGLSAVTICLVVSTFLVVSGVVTAALVVVLAIAVTDADQPATLRRRTRRAQRAEKPQPAPTAVEPEDHGPSGPTEREFQGPSGPTERESQGPSGPTERESQGPSGPPELEEPAPPQPVPVAAGYQPSRRQRRRDLTPVAQPELTVPTGRMRSGVALVVMIAAMGTMVALAVGAAVAFTALALREAVG